MPRTAYHALVALLLFPAAVRAQGVLGGYFSDVPGSFASSLSNSFALASFSNVSIAGQLDFYAGTVPASVTLSPGIPAYLRIYGTLSGAETLIGSLGTNTCPAGGEGSAFCAFPFSTQSFGASTFDGIVLRLAYTQTGVGSRAYWSMRASLGNATTTVVPEPATLALLAPAVLAVGGIVARRRRAIA